MNKAEPMVIAILGLIFIGLCIYLALKLYDLYHLRRRLRKPPGPPPSLLD